MINGGLKMSKKLENKVFLITGAASGMGKATVTKFEAEGAYIVAVDRNTSVVEVWDGHNQITPLIADVTKLDDIKNMAKTVKETYGHLDGVCNIAGINDLSYPLLETDDERWDNVMNIDLKAPFRILREMMPLMIENGGGSIVNIGSYAAAMGGVDVVLFTGGAGENQWEVREGATAGLEFMGIKVDADKNKSCRATEAIISTDDSKVKVCVIPTDEELMIATDTFNIVNGK